MISHVLYPPELPEEEKQGFPIGSKMPGAFDTVEALLKAFVRDDKPRGYQPKPGETPKPQLKLLVFTDGELKRMMTETVSCSDTSALYRVAKMINKGLGLRRGFHLIRFTKNDESRDRGLIFCPESMNWPVSLNGLQTGPTRDDNREDTSYMTVSS